MSEWRGTTLGNLSLDVSYGYTASANFENGQSKFLRITDIQNGIVNWKTVPYCSIDHQNYQKYKLLDGDIVIARTGNSTGENYLFCGDENVVFASYLVRFRIDKNIAYPRFVWYTLRTPDWWQFINNSKTGSAQAGANAKVLGSFPILLPPLPEQKAIARILGSLDDKIELNRRMNETLEAMARAIFKDWFVDFGPTRAKMEGRAPYLPEPIWSLFPEAIDPLSGLPVGWKLGTIGECFNLVMGQSPPGKTYNDNGQGLPFFQGRTDFGFRFPENRKYCTSPTRIAEANDTLVSVRAPVGDINMAWEKCCIGRGIASLRHKSGTPGFTYYSAWAIQQELFKYEHTGTVFGSITKNQLMSLSTIEPSQDFLKLFDEYMSPIDESIRSC